MSSNKDYVIVAGKVYKLRATKGYKPFADLKKLITAKDMFELAKGYKNTNECNKLIEQYISKNNLKYKTI